MSGRLARSLDEIAATGAAWLTETELETLVEIAKAAQELEKWEPNINLTQLHPQHRDALLALRAALARLDATTTEAKT